MGELELIRVTNPHYLGMIAPQIKELVDRLDPVGITYESLWTYFSQSVQMGGDKTEFWVVYNEEKPVAFAHWFMMGLPNIGKVCCDYIKSWNRMHDPVARLLDKFLEFGERNRCPVYEGFAANEALYKVWKNAAKSKGIGIRETGILNFIGRKEWVDQ